MVELMQVLADPKLLTDIERIRELSASSDPDPSLLDSTPHPRSRKPRRLTATEIDDMVTKYESGATVPDLVEQFGIHRTTVLGHLKRRSVETRVKCRAMTDEQVAQAVEHYQAGDSLATVGNRFGVVAETVRKELIKAGVNIRSNARR